MFILDVVKLAVIQQQFWVKECDLFRGVKTYSDPPTYFQGGGPDPRNPPMIYAPGSGLCIHAEGEVHNFKAASLSTRRQDRLPNLMKIHEQRLTFCLDTVYIGLSYIFYYASPIGADIKRWRPSSVWRVTWQSYWCKVRCQGLSRSVCPCLTLSREWQGIARWKLATRKPMAWVTRDLL